ncbi:MAG TPA: transglutaminase-like domain-containing protein [Usitatibacteraceae bacterium]|nr:transglutaminase-like domain-containing protein [Usitatibacteraceae bacterium]
MNRRSFLKAGSITPLAPVALGAGASLNALAQSAVGTAFDGWRVFEVVAKVEMLKPSGTTRVWLPTPLTSDTSYQKSLGNAVQAEGGKLVPSNQVTDQAWGLGIVSAEFPEGVKPLMSLTSRFATRDYSVDPAKGRGMLASADEQKRFLKPSELLPTDGIVKSTADGITKGLKNDVDKAKAIYEWVVENTHRDPKVRGCGVGDVKFMLENKSYGGKCGDLNALFVALARASGVPARDVYGIRVADSRRGYKSLGKAGDITKAQHCRAEFYAQGIGWIPVDPADVRKVILEEEGGKKIDDPKVAAARQYLWGNWEMNWLALNYAHDVALPGSNKSKLGFFMYPNAETADGRLDQLDPDNFRYTITSREISA